ncbi:MAG: hypothetical protein KGJ62_01495 [Armatimonadetes bacterium]|nr:hypothetical protein [Armatimonadota bacterium]MDE2205822.1 hypothetical protein [Armatimonadota bacterium]
MREPIVETSIRLVQRGCDLWVPTRAAKIVGTRLTENQRERMCGRLRYQQGLASVVVGNDALLVATSRAIPEMRMQEENWEATILDAGEPARQLSLREERGRASIPDLVERAVLAQVHRKRRRWTLSSPRKWYDPEPFQEEMGIAAYRCIALGARFIEEVGIGIAADVQTAFLTTQNLAWFFDPTQSAQERERRHTLFDRLANRQEGQRGTLVYSMGRTMRVYFSHADGKTCGQVPIRVKDQTYSSLTDYYTAVYPELGVTDDTPAVYVFFDMGERPVAGSLLRVRVMNDNLPRGLRDIDKIAPADRRNYIDGFWAELGDRPCGFVAPGTEREYWRPAPGRVWRPALPTLEFGRDRKLAPTRTAATVHASYHRRRTDMLSDGGFYYLPPTTHRTLYCAYPKGMGLDAAQRFISSMCEMASDWTGSPFAFELVEYGSIEQAVDTLQRVRDDGMVVFVLNEEPAAYYSVAKGLDGWRVKRVTQRRLCSSYRSLIDGVTDRRTGKVSVDRGRREWEQFVRMSALDVLQQMDAIPWRIDGADAYDAQLVIDVGHDRRYLGFTILVNRGVGLTPAFQLWSDVQQKLDTKAEAINPEFLQNELVRFIKDGWPRRDAHPLTSLLVIRDGRICAGEAEAIETAKQRLIRIGCLSEDARVDLIELHKETQFPVRLWEIDEAGAPQNVAEPTAVQLTTAEAVFVGTTRATLTQGTSEPILLTACNEGAPIRKAVDSYAATTQLNWSNPAKEQTIAVHVKRADDDLIARSQQEIKRTR